MTIRKGVRTMKATLSINTRKAIEIEVAKELERQRAVVYRQAAEDLMPQALAFFLWTMQLNYGWGEKRLRKLVDDLHETDHLMNSPSPMHHRFNSLDCEEMLKDKYGIDIRAEFPIVVEDKKGQVIK